MKTIAVCPGTLATGFDTAANALAFFADGNPVYITKGLIPESEYSDVYSKTSHPCKDDFITFGTRIGVLPKKQPLLLNYLLQSNPRYMNS